MIMKHRLVFEMFVTAVTKDGQRMVAIEMFPVHKLVSEIFCSSIQTIIKEFLIL